MKEFNGVVKKLVKTPCLDIALDANIHSLRTMEFFDKDASNGKAFYKEATEYLDIIRSCLRKFREMIPNLNGQVRHVELYSEQMSGRLQDVNKMYPV